MTVHINDHWMLFIVCSIIRVECRDDSAALGIRLCGKCLAVIGQRLRFRDRGTRHLGLRCIDITSLSRHPVKCNILDALAGSRCCQSLGDLRPACEIPLARRVGCVPELVGERIERCAHEILVRRRCRFRIETCAVRRQRDAAARRRILDMEVAALHRRRCRGIMRIEYARMSAVVVNRNILVVFLEDHACIIDIAAAPQSGKMAADEGLLFKNCGGLVPILIVPRSTICQ